jgi:26S proteasome regulatory subunit T5
MSTLEDLDDMEREEREEKEKKKQSGSGDKQPGKGDAEMKDAEKQEEEEEDVLDEEILHSSTRDIQMRKRLLENDLRIMKSEFQRLSHEQSAMKDKIKDNLEKIENNRYVPSSE